MSSRRLAAVVAHPDDDTFGCAGTVALHTNDPDFHFVLIHVTSGEHGQIAEGYAADFVVLDGALQVSETWISGERVYRA